FADGDFRREGAAILALSGDLPARADDARDAGLAIAAQIGIVPAVVGLVHQYRQVAAYRLRSRIAEGRLRRAAEAGDGPGFVAGDDGIRHRIEDRGQARAMLL